MKQDYYLPYLRKEYTASFDYILDKAEVAPVTVDKATPEDFKKRKQERIKELQDSIKKYHQWIRDAELEIEGWEEL